jgi:thiol-disulfide isomerase/thioredoxin
MENIYDIDSPVKELIFNDFDFSNNKISIKNKKLKNKNSFLIFYAPWCSHCVESKEMWEDIACMFEDIIYIYAINCYNYFDNNQELVEPFNISYYPTIKFVKENEIIDYKDKKDKDTIVSFLLSNYKQKLEEEKEKEKN